MSPHMGSEARPKTLSRLALWLALTSPGGRCIRLALFMAGCLSDPRPLSAQVVELVDALASGASVRKDVEVRVLSWAPLNFNKPLNSKY